MLMQVGRQDTVAEEREDNEEDGEDHSFVIHSSLGLNAVIHDNIPVFSCQDLQRERKGDKSLRKKKAPTLGEKLTNYGSGFDEHFSSILVNPNCCLKCEK